MFYTKISRVGVKRKRGLLSALFFSFVAATTTVFPILLFANKHVITLLYSHIHTFLQNITPFLQNVTAGYVICIYVCHIHILPCILPRTAITLGSSQPYHVVSSSWQHGVWGEFGARRRIHISTGVTKWWRGITRGSNKRHGMYMCMMYVVVRCLAGCIQQTPPTTTSVYTRLKMRSPLLPYSFFP